MTNRQTDKTILILFIGQDIITAGFSGALHAGVLTAGAILHRNLFNDLSALTKEIRKINKEKKIQ